MNPIAEITHDRLIIQSSTFAEAQDIIDDMMKLFSDVTATIPVKAADGSYIASVRYSSGKIRMEGI